MIERSQALCAQLAERPLLAGEPRVVFLVEPEYVTTTGNCLMTTVAGEQGLMAPPHCFRSLTGPSKQVLATSTDGEASGPSEFKVAYANDESRRRLLWEQEVPSSSLGAPTS